MLNEYDKMWCMKLLNELNKMPITAPFRQAVDPIRDNAENYFNIITNPMDLGTMKKKLNNEEYHSVSSFIDDIKLICSNAKLFNGADSLYGLICDDILTEVLKQYSEKPDNQHQEWFKSLNKAVEELKEHMKSAPLDVTLNFDPIQMPDVSGLTPEQITKIENVIGGDSIEKLANRWPFLNKETQTKIADIARQES